MLPQNETSLATFSLLFSQKVCLIWPVKDHCCVQLKFDQESQFIEMVLHIAIQENWSYLSSFSLGLGLVCRKSFPEKKLTK